jgi:hypothetical protein
MDAIAKGLACAIASVPFLIACGGGKAGDPGAIQTNQCSGASCGVQGPPSQTADTSTLCPANADIVKSTYLGGAGSGEVVSLNIDAVKMTYTLKFFDSPIPVAAGNVDNTRANTTVTGAVMHPPAGMLPNAEQTRCAFMLTPASGTAPSTGSTYTTPFSSTNPPIVFVGKGVAGGGIPGATISYSGPAGIGSVNSRSFDFYPFLGFASTSTDLSKLAGTYNGLLYHIQPTAQFTARAINTIETFDANGACSAPINPSTSTASPSSPNPTTQCLTTGDAYTLNANGYFDSSTAPQIEAQYKIGGLVSTGKSAKAHMILGQLNGATVPVVVRTGNVSTTGLPAIDDESGIAMLASATPLASGGFNGGYVGADSNFRYTASLITGELGSFINPTTQAAEGGFSLKYGQSSDGLVTVTDTQGNTGLAIAAGGLYAIFIYGTENGGVAPSSANANTANSPYFSVGAQIGK